MNARILPGMSLSVSWCDGQLLKLPFSVPAENVEDPGCGVHADGWRGAWCCPCRSSPRGEIRLGSRAQRGVSLVSSCRLASPHIARFLSSSLIWLLHQPNKHTLRVCVRFLAMGAPAASLGPPPCQGCAGPCPYEDHVPSRRGTAKGEKTRKKEILSNRTGKRKRKKLKKRGGLQFQGRLQ